MGCGLMVGLATLSLILVVTGLETNHIDPYNEIPDEANNIADTRRAEEVHEEQILEYKDTKGRVQVDHNGGHDRLGHFTPTWAIHVPGGKGEADAVAAEHGFVNLGEIFDNHFHFHHTRVRKRSIDPASAQHERLASDARVRWARQQRILSRAKRDLIYIPQDPRHKRDVQSSRTKGKPRSADNKFILNDPKWPHMWYLNRGGGLDMNVIPAWREGITGRGVVVTILDDGLETDHPDLIANYDALASYDVNSHDSDPQPRYDMIDSNRHGTRCAGEVAATANNSLCAVGVAFGARVGGVRMLDGDVTDAVEARSLSLNPQHVDIYSASWGPDDDGKTVDGPGELATRAFIEGVNKGRNGKGSIFIWASGNGGRDQDNCNCDGYTNSIWTLSISSATERGDVPWYSEMCSSTLATTYSSGALNEKQVVTTDLHHSCTSGHTGTSASAPLAAGICALALQANRDLTWRDMQHIVVRTSRPERLSASGNWHINGVGRNVSHSFGYGLLDAAGMVRLARNWRTVPPQRRCELAAAKPERAVPARGSVVLQMNVQSCPGVNYLEHVQAKVTLSSTRRGDLQIFLTSPAGTRVTLLAPRAHDTSRAGFNSWPFMSVHMWGESPIGVWQLEVHNEGRYMGGALTQWELIFYGTDTPPHEDGSPAVDDNYLGSSESKSRSGYPSKTHMRGEEEKPHNDLEDDMTLDVWSTHKIREDAGTSQSEGRTAQGMTSGCVATSVTSSNHCIECQQTFHLFDGRCYAHCPSHTYTSETLTHTRSQNVTSTSTTEPPNISSSLMKRAFHSREGISEGQSSEIADMLAYEEQPKTPNICLPCHYTCLTCKGPSNHDCLTCPEDAQLVNVTSSDDGSKLFFCYPSSLVPQISNGKWYHQLNLYFAIIVFVIATVVLYKFFTCAINYGFCDFCCCSKDTTDSVAYNKVALDEKQQSAFEITAEIKRAIESSSESETEDDLNL